MLTGVVTDSVGGDSIAGVLIVGYEHGADTTVSAPIFEAITDSLGIYTVEDEIFVGEYDIYVSYQGFLPYFDTITIVYGLNIYNIGLKRLTGIAEGISLGIIPQSYALYQSCPNPFSQSTVIRYQIPKLAVGPYGSAVNLTIYNLSGRLVRTLVDESQKLGYYKIIWDGKDASGRKVSTGTYFCRLEVDNFVSTKKLTVIR